MIVKSKDLSSITVSTDSGMLSCTYLAATQEELKKCFDIDIGKEIEKLLINNEHSGYQHGEYTFSFANKHLSLHHVDIKQEIKNVLSNILKRYTYEPNDEDTRMNVTTDIMNYFNILRDKGALYDYNVICDDTNNTNDIVIQNKLLCRVGLKFTKDSEFIILDAMVSSQTKVDDAKGNSNEQV